MECSNCRYFNWQEAAKYFGHPCDKGSDRYQYDGWKCEVAEPKVSETGCLRIGNRMWNQYGLYCGECEFDGRKQNCPRNELMFEGLKK